MITEKGILPIGVEYKGKTHRDFELRPQKVKDSVDVMEDPRAQKNDGYFGVAVLARQIEKLGDVPKEEITPALLLEMWDDDLKALHEAKGRVSQKLASFRGEDKEP